MEENEKSNLINSSKILIDNISPLNPFQFPQRIAYFISDHGLGHAARSCAIINALLQMNPNLQVKIVSEVPSWFFKERLLSERITHFSTKVDVGMYQKTSVEIDGNKTLQQLELFWNKIEEKIEKILDELKSWNTNKILFDVTCLGPLIGSQLSIPSIGVSNFSWDWIYSEYVKTYPKFQEYIEKIAFYYSKTTLFLELPYPGDLSAFKCPHIQLPWVAEISTHNKHEIKEKLGFSLAKFTLLCSFGGHNFPIENMLHGWKIPSTEWQVIWLDLESKIPKHEVVSGLIILYPSDLSNLKIAYVDLVACADVLILKTGYGIVSEAIANGVSVLYTDRPGFLEHGNLVKALKNSVRCDEISIQDLEQMTPTLFDKARQIIPNQKKDSIGFDGAKIAAIEILKLNNT